MSTALTHSAILTRNSFLSMPIFCFVLLNVEHYEFYLAGFKLLYFRLVLGFLLTRSLANWNPFDHFEGYLLYLFEQVQHLFSVVYQFIPLLRNTFLRILPSAPGIM